MYRIELWNAAHTTRLGILEADEASVRITESLNGEHTLSFRIPYDDPARGSVVPLAMVRVFDESLQAHTTVSSASSAGGGRIYLISNADFSVGDYAFVGSEARPYLSKISSLTGTDSAFLTRMLDTDPNHLNAQFYKATFDLFRIRALTDERAEGGVPFMRIECDHFSYGIQNRLHQHAGRSDFSWGMNRKSGQILGNDATVAEVADHIFQNFDASSFALGVVDLADKKEISFERENCLESWFKLPGIFPVDGRINLDHTADLLHFIGNHSSLRVEYGKNLGSITRRTDASSLVNILYPKGAASAWADTYSGVEATLASTEHGRSRLYLSAGDGLKFRYGDVVVVFFAPTTGTIESATPTSATATGDPQWDDNQFLGKMLLCQSNVGAGQLREISFNTHNSFDLVEPFHTTPTSGTGFVVSATNPEITDITGFSTITTSADNTSTNSYIDDSGIEATADLYVGGSIEFMQGVGVGQIRTVESNTTTRFIPTIPFTPSADESTVFRLKATPENSDILDISSLAIDPTDSARVYLALHEEGNLIPGKDFLYRDTVQTYADSGGDYYLGVGDGATFADAYAVRISDTVLGSLAIPYPIISESIINSIEGNNLILRSPVATVPTSAAHVEIIAFKDSTSIASWGERPGYFSATDEHSPFLLAKRSKEKLSATARPQADYSIKFGDLYEFNRAEFDQDKVRVGDLFDLIDDELPTANETLTYGNVFTVSASGTAATLSATPSPSWQNDEWRGQKIDISGQRRAIWTNNASQMITEAFTVSPSPGDTYSILSALRIIRKTWNPFDPSDLEVDVIHGK